MKRIGIIGGSGLYEMDGFVDEDDQWVNTPFGSPSGEIVCGNLNGVPVAFLARHGPGHVFTPSTVNYRANIWALKSVGVDFLLTVSATGSMREEIEPGHLVFPNQFIDRTRGIRKHTFFDEMAAHVGFADPMSGGLIQLLANKALELDITHHVGGTYVCIEGPQFSTRAESRLYRSWDGVVVIGMTQLTEAKLAREAQIPYACIAMATDYDVWHESEEDVSVDAVVATMKKNAAKAQALLTAVVPQVAAQRGIAYPEHSALQHALMTDRSLISAEKWDQVKLLFGEE